MQEETLSLLRSLKQEIEEIIKPLDTSIEEANLEGERYQQNSLDLVMSDLTMMVVILTNTDSNISNDELDLINNIRHAVYGYGIPVLKSNDYVNLFREFLHIYPEKRLTLDHIPISIRLLKNYDQQHKTNYTDKVKNLFIQFAQAIVRADKQEDIKENIILNNFLDSLKSL
jgi:hypothetical protein